MLDDDDPKPPVVGGPGGMPQPPPGAQVPGVLPGERPPGMALMPPFGQPVPGELFCIWVLLLTPVKLYPTTKIDSSIPSRL